MFIGLFCLVGAAAAMSGNKTDKDADTLLVESNELFVLAQRGHCKKIGERVRECYETGCGDEIQSSILWFTNTYGVPPELACTQEKGFFVRRGK